MTEGWQAEKRAGEKVYHYIRDTMALCQKLGFYMGGLDPDHDNPRGKEDCAACFRLRAKERAKSAKAKVTQ